MPERFNEENEKQIYHYAYIPFGGEPKVCIGSRFAMIEQKLIVAMVAQRYRLALVPEEKVEMEPLITIRPKYGMRMQLSKHKR